jgi:hemolysin III
MEASTATSRPKPRFRGWVHVIGAIGFVPAVALLILHARSGAGFAAAVYGGSLLALLISSAVYHTPYWPKPTRARLRLVDHSMIYVLIAGSYTPLLFALGGSAVTVMLPAVWVAALLGMVKTMVWPHPPRWISTGLYVAFGWGLVPYGPALYTALGPVVLTLIGAGGFMYTLGAVIYARKWPNPDPLTFGYHEIFHVMVVVASACLFAAMWITVG